MKRIILSSILLLLLSNFTFAQVKKYGKSITQDFETNLNTKHKDANAIVLYKYQKVYYNYGGGRLYINTIIRERIKILNREGFTYATKKIHFYSKENVSIKAVTYTKKGEKAEKIKLKKSDIYEEKINKNWNAKIFTMPNISEGCIVEWEYHIQSPYIYSINDFVFQYNIPIQYYKGKIAFPEELSANYKYTDDFKINFTKNEGLEIKIDDVEALKEEPFINNIENYRGKISFEITKSDFLISDGYGGSENVSKQFSRNWEDVTSSLYKDSRFGDELKKTNYFKSDLQEVIKNAKTELEKIDAILAFVKNKVKWNNYFGIFTQKGVKTAYKDGVGNVAEINLILTAMLRESGLDVSPILVSTRAHKKPVFPTRDGFNYVIAGVELLNKIILLDATEAYSLPNVLPKRVLNWQGRIIRKHGSSAFINLFPEKYNVNKSRLNVKMDESGNIKGNFNIAYKNLNALTYRKRWNGLANESLINNLEAQYQPIEIEKVSLRNENNLENPFLISMQYVAENQADKMDDKLFFSPLFFLRDKENIFKSNDRRFPIDFAAPWMRNYEVIIQIPEGYKVEKIPENIIVETENKIGLFSYKTIQKGNRILVKVNTKIHLPIVAPNFYKELQDFYTKRILKEKEKIVLVKE